MITATQLRRADKKTQEEVMRDWFYENFQDPVDCCPYDSGEGGYQFLHGGPYEPLEVLSDEFDGVVRKEVLEKLADELADQSWEWDGRDREGDYDIDTQWDPTNYFFQSLYLSAGPFAEFQRSIGDIQGILKDPIVEGATGQCVLRLLYANVITALEAYLADFFSTAITEHKELLRTFVEKNPDFTSRKMPYSDIFKEWEGLESKVKAYLVEIVWHHLHRVMPMFKDTLGIQLSNADDLFKAVVVRHDLVHRNGKKKGGGEHSLRRDDVEKLITTAENFVRGIEAEWEMVKPVAKPLVASSQPATAVAAPAKEKPNDA